MKSVIHYIDSQLLENPIFGTWNLAIHCYKFRKTQSKSIWRPTSGLFLVFFDYKYIVLFDASILV